MDTITKIRQKAKARPKTIVLPEYYEARTQEAAKIIEGEGIAKVLLLRKELVDPKEKERYIQEYYQMYQAKDVSLDTVKHLFEDTLYYAAMMAREGKVDGLVAGAEHTTSDVARAVIRCLGVDERITIVSSCFIMVVPNCPYGDNGTFVFADCGVIPKPNSRQLACIAVSAAEMCQKVLDLTPRVAMLSYSTKGSAKGKGVDEVNEALGLIKEMAPELLVDGELQADAAIVPEIAAIKYPDSLIAGKANVLIFPNLEAGNICYKLVQRLSQARAIGPLFLGLNKPASDLSRGCIVDDIVDCVAATSIRAK
jgi:phosphate acetyltransferase